MVANFDAKLQEYASLLVRVGMNVQPGQTPNIRGDVDAAPLVRKCVEEAYKAGARDVLVEWSDDVVSRQKYLHAHEAVFSEFPEYMQARFDYLLDTKCPRMSITGSDPEALKGVDPARIRAWQSTSGSHTREYFDALTSDAFQWCVAAYATPGWAQKVFPELEEAAAVDALWEAIFAVCRIQGDGKAVERWQQHCASIKDRCRKLNDYNFESLHYSNSLGTDLTIRLPENHIWSGGSEDDQNGTTFVANIPTEEIFTAPQRDGVNGRVYATLPLALNGNLVKDFYMDFEDGKIVAVHAEEGEELLKNATTLDEGASYLGEVALVPYDSPIRARNILFYNTLFDENASCHLAFGDAYPNCVKGGEKLSEADRLKAGLNQSMTHVDFMVGSRDMSIVGKTHDGKEIPVFVDGNFVI